MPTTTIEDVKVDRPHRYRVGALVRHVDSPPTRENVSFVRELTFTVRFTEDGPVAYPTYTLSHYRDGDVTGVLCTDDLIGGYQTVAA